MNLLSVEEIETLKADCKAFMDWQAEEDARLPPPPERTDDMRAFVAEVSARDDDPQVQAHKAQAEMKAEAILSPAYKTFCGTLESFGIPQPLALAAWAQFPEYFNSYTFEVRLIAAEMFDNRRGNCGYSELEVDSLEGAMARAQKTCGYAAFEDYDSMGRSLEKRRLGSVVRNTEDRDNRRYVLSLYRLFTYALSTALAGEAVDLPTVRTAT